MGLKLGSKQKTALEKYLDRANKYGYLAIIATEKGNFRLAKHCGKLQEINISRLMEGR